MIKNSGLNDTIMVIITNSKGYSEVIPICQQLHLTSHPEQSSK